MNRWLSRYAIPVLRWTLGIVVLLESIHATLSASAAHHFVKMGLPGWAGHALGGTEVAAVLLFLLPATRVIGGYLLLVIFAIAAAMHLLHGESDVAALVVYAAAVLVCIAPMETQSDGARHDG
jgi:hypothetical protein